MMPPIHSPGRNIKEAVGEVVCRVEHNIGAVVDEKKFIARQMLCIMGNKYYICIVDVCALT